MEKRRLGKTGWDVSEIGLGCWQLGGEFGAVDDARAAAILAEANSLGVDFWDTADGYGGGLSEQRIGAALSQSPGVTVATKVGRGGNMFTEGFTRLKLREDILGSAQRLGVATISLVQLHCVPSAVLEDGEVFAWLEEFQDEGLIRHFGASVETVAEGMLCLRQPRLSTLQIIFSLFRQDAADELLPAAAAAEVGIIVRLPLASGLLSGKFAQGHRFADDDHRNFNANGELFSVGETFAGVPFENGVEFVREIEALNATGWPLSQMAIRWILDHPEVSSVIAGVSRPEQLANNVEAASRPPLSAELHDALKTLYRNKIRPTVRSEI